MSAKTGARSRMPTHEVLLSAPYECCNRHSLSRLQTDAETGAVLCARSSAYSRSPRALLGGLTRQFLKTCFMTPSDDRSPTHCHSLSFPPSFCIIVRSALQLVNWRDVRVPTLTAWINASTTNRSVRATDVVAISRAGAKERERERKITQPNNKLCCPLPEVGGEDKRKERERRQVKITYVLFFVRVFVTKYEI